MLPETKLDIMLARHASLQSELSGQLPAETYVKLTRELAEIAPVVEKVKAYRHAIAEIADLDHIIADPATDAEMRAIAGEERPLLERKRDALEQDIKLALIPKDAMDDRNVILEIRAGTGGDEAALFAGDLYRMYERYAAVHGWKSELLSASEGTKGGYKEIIAEIRGRGAFAKLKFESGVHRVQRVPDTEASGRIHTSAATVAVLPEAEDLDIAINDAERRGQVGTGDRSERIRTYNYPQARVSDHRINLTLYKLPQILEGEALGEIIDALVAENQAALLAAEDVN